MGYRVTKDLTTTNENTYADVDAWVADHGPCGTEHENVVNGKFIRMDESSVRRVLEYTDEAAYTEHTSVASPTSYSTSDTITETF